MKIPTSFQIERSEFLAGRSVRADFTGTGAGKTVSALRAVDLVNGKSAQPDPVILAGPPISLRMWKAEFEEMFPAREAQILYKGKTIIDPNAGALICSYAIAAVRFEELRDIGAVAFSADEAHALKNHESVRTQKISGPGGIADGVDYYWPLTGSPVVRWNDDIYPFLLRAAPEVLKERTGGTSFDRFRLRYCVTQKRTFSPRQRIPKLVTVGNRNTDELNEILYKGGLAIRHELKDVWADAPPLYVTPLVVEPVLTPELREMLKAFNGLSQRDQDAAVARNDESMSKVRRLLGLAKVKNSASEIVDRLAAGTGPILIGAWHTTVLDELCEAITKAGYKAAVLDGRTSAAQKGVLQDDFNDGKLDALLGQISAMGVSLNLQHGGSYIIVVEEDWSPSIMDQFYARLLRMGQLAGHVQVDIFRSDNSLEDAIARVSGRKRKGQSEINKQDELT